MQIGAKLTICYALVQQESMLDPTYIAYNVFKANAYRNALTIMTLSHVKFMVRQATGLMFVASAAILSCDFRGNMLLYELNYKID